MGFFEKINAGLSRSRERLKEQMNILLDRGPDVDEDFWETLEETLILADLGASAADEIVEELRDQARRKALPDAYAVFDMLTEQIASTFTPAEEDVFEKNPSLVQEKLLRLVKWRQLLTRRAGRYCLEAQILFVRQRLSSWKFGHSVLRLKS